MGKRVVNEELHDNSLAPDELHADSASKQRSFYDLANAEERKWQVLVRSLFPSKGARRLIGICSLNGAESTNALAANLSLNAAKYLGTPVLIVEAHRSQSSLAESLGAVSTPGLGDLLMPPAEEAYQCIHRTRYSKLWIMPSGRELPISNHGQLDVYYRRLYGMLPPVFHNIVVALPPINSAAYIEFPCSTLDRIVLTVRPDSVASRSLRKVIDRLSAANATVAGVIWVNGQ
ncbi:MAG: hypothetical protein WAM39_28885 [Bryobacteraceae bacterium]